MADDEPDSVDVDFRELIAPCSLEKFTAEYWGQRIHTGALSEQALAVLLAGFGGGDMAAVLPQCRKEDNLPYSTEEMKGMEADFDEHRRTLDLPLCFCPSADALRNAFIEACPDFGNDVEVGVYFSKLGGGPSTWHYDNNHNVTIQLCGRKDWSCIPGSTDTVGSRSMQGVPKNRHEQRRHIPPTGCGDVTTFSLRPGSVIYIPPGHWHNVVAVSGEDSFSADLRVGNILHAKWIAEAVFAGLLDEFYCGGPPPAEPLAVGPCDFGGGVCRGVKRQLAYVSEHADRLVQRCRLPRCLPFQREHSDGMAKGAELAWLRGRGFAAAAPAASDTIGINGLVTILLKRCEDHLIVQLLSESSLSTMEYLRFAVLCDNVVRDPMDHLVRAGSLTWKQMQQHCAVGSRKELMSLVRVLLYMNVLYSESRPSVGSATTSEAEPNVKRRRGAAMPGARFCSAAAVEGPSARAARTLLGDGDGGLVRQGYERIVGSWLLGTSGMLISMIAIGGYTRLSGSGLSMTDWRIEGRALPRTEEAWQQEFDNYKLYPEYQRLHAGSMEMDEFRRIYFVEWFHRMWGRTAGLLFAAPLAYFVARRVIRARLGLRLSGLLALGISQAFVGWWMVRSGLDAPEVHTPTLGSSQRPRVSPYRLASHWTAALTLYAGCTWCALSLLRPSPAAVHSSVNAVAAACRLRRVALPVAGLVGVTLLSGPFVAGNDAGHAYNTWPKMLDDWVPPEWWEAVRAPLTSWRSFFENTAVVQFDHRTLAYSSVLSSLALYAYSTCLPLAPAAASAMQLLPAAIAAQMCLGIATLMLYVPIELGVAHQAGGVGVLTVLIFVLHTLRTPALLL